MMKGSRFAIVALVLALSAGISLAEEAKVSSNTIQIEGSTTVGPIAEAFAEAFMKANPSISITVKKTGSGDGAAALVDGRCQIAAMSRFMKEKEMKAAVDKKVLPCAHVVAMDGICVVVHPSNSVKNLSKQQIRDIYMGNITNWKAVGGPDLPIVVISRDTSSGTYDAFIEMCMGKDNKMAGSVEYVNSNPQAHSRVSTTPGAVGYVGLGFVDDKVKAVEVDFVAPSRKTIVAGTYPLSRPLFLFTNGYPELGMPLHAFVTFALTEKGQEIIEAKGFIPLTSY
jgi:phosphate transport system substrate-binding protein